MANANIVLPLNHVVAGTITRTSQFATVKGFSTQLILTDVAVAGEVDATNRTKEYFSKSDVLVDYGAATDTYLAANAALSQLPRPDSIKLGYIDTTATIADELAAIQDCDDNWYVLSHIADMRDNTYLNDISIWVEGQYKQFLTETNDVLNEDPGTVVAPISTMKAAGYKRTSGFYSDDATQYLAQEYGSLVLRFNFDQPNTNYTGKFKRPALAPALNLRESVIHGITGFNHATGLDPATGNLLNVVVNVGGKKWFEQGNSFHKDTFFDQTHKEDWLLARVQAAICNVLGNAAAVPYTNQGTQLLVNAVISVLETADAAGILGERFDTEGELLPLWELTVQRTSAVSAALRSQRIAPTIEFCVTFANAIHYASFTGCIEV